MKWRLVLFLLLVVSPCVANAAGGGHYSIIKRYDGETSINYDKEVNPKQWYLNAHAAVSFLSWKNEYTYGSDGHSDKFNFKPFYGLDLAVGCKFDKTTRIDLEFDYIGRYSEEETYIDDSDPNVYYYPEKTDFILSGMALTANGYYDFKSGVYM